MFSISIKAEMAVKTIAKLDSVSVGGNCACGDTPRAPTPPPRTPTPPPGILDKIRFFI